MIGNRRIVNSGILILITLIFLGSFILIGMNVREENERKDISIEASDRGRIIPGSRASPFISSVVPSSGYKGSTNEIVGGDFGDTKGRVGLEPTAGGAIICLIGTDIINCSL